ncbi:MULTISPECIES: hypothetical protein [Rhizobium]|uniref:hypothetical protein n=1 Tax=Rhizobium TaxID=379 RepID=UPI00193367C1|nr:hypothetical protein [Rhizobium rosettiformans]
MSMETTGSDAGCQRKNDRVSRIFQGEEKILRVFIIIREGRVKAWANALLAGHNALRFGGL